MISFHFNEVRINLPNRNRLRDHIEGIFKQHRKKLAFLSIIFCNDKFLLHVNREFLGHDYYTDIITFDLSEDREVNAEIYISVDRLRENSEINQVTLKDEMHRVIFHGVLHLCGLNDKSKKDKTKMTKAEDYALFTYFQCPTK
jgi:probable rRNA maturation factor